ncbi:type II toxin-antitoxin system RelE/ParE family toxin [Ralstonia pseudosolanacearum]|uniref:type II toxin-antitoxin system RelE/ParE family toxin n=1 Tax=Ralstonia pseudosolanacearum TaxID=1310165 RepID=UPI000CE53868|nr:type II toxin-antitoxin system RelE/ParE family toxin [Ralstonia pseudosolanacearum]MDO3509905.1 type II toxin-antitoxin system RelE/ParE family toxin [Ralstonia pseudosolanacearum]MDO3514958.1 type II toxin-antitoxin system RelE/ParE family toxin [Ralstonia pseudosolanacearum]MDO3539744.1 type II toxin-antitoxin system RelE/ParE family toxin [Ralstonia pseudosolanacearum]MDO3608834.1 type II toxin-antitoxin system RelE/ParE family toxin [Ralstonia pseudosolanacearum]MDO3613864.1 type II to
MLTIRTTEIFDDWFCSLRDKAAQRRIQVRIDRLQMGNPGDMKAVRDGIRELRIDHGPGDRLYFVRHGVVLIVLLCDGDKSTQETDIRRAIDLSRRLDVDDME